VNEQRRRTEGIGKRANKRDFGAEKVIERQKETESSTAFAVNPLAVENREGESNWWFSPPAINPAFLGHKK
jgi:hypothetical protein